MDKQFCIFDMDGTLADTSPGIISSFFAVAHEFGVKEPPVELLYRNIGGSLVDNLQRLYGLTRDQAMRGSQIFRDYYGEEGYLQAELYPGMRETLGVIADMGMKLGVATMKLDEYAKLLVREWRFENLFVDVCGADHMGQLTKSDLIDRCIYAADTDPSRTVMVGDSANDYRGAISSGAGFIAVTYGYGFNPETCERNGIIYARSPAEIPDLL